MSKAELEGDMSSFSNFFLLFSPQTKFEFVSLVHDFRMSLLMEFEAKLCSNLA